MKIVLDTNAFVSGVFFGGPPGLVIDAWRAGRFQLTLSLDILQEYAGRCDQRDQRLS